MKLVAIDQERLEAVAEFLAANRASVPNFNYCGPYFPQPGEPFAPDFFLFTALNQYGFWFSRGRRYQGPLYLPLGGQVLKGSDYLFMAFLRHYRKHRPAVGDWASLSARGFAAITRSDNGGNIPQLASHWELTRNCARALRRRKLTPSSLLARCNRSKTPLASFLRAAGSLPGYREDPLEKKLNLLAYILRVRPEKFLKPSREKLPPIIDYHMQRVLLRLGVLAVTPALGRQLAARTLLGEAAERQIRRAAYHAFAALTAAAQVTTEQLDYRIFSLRKVCSETGAPACGECPLAAACMRRVRLFQPVRRTTFY